MSFNLQGLRSSLVGAGAIVLTVALTGCGLSINDKPPVVKNPDFRAGEKAQCLSEVLPTLSRFVQGTANSQSIEETWDCFAVGINLYSTYIRGRQENQYTPRELVKFFEDYFLKDVKINDRLLGEIMKIKQIVVGGSADYLTRDELTRLVEVSKQFKVMSLKALPYMKVYTFNWKVSTYKTLENDVHYFEDANATIQEVAKDLATIISKNDKSYTISNMVVLMDEMSKLYGTNWPAVQDLEKVLPLVYKLKKTLAGGEEASIASNEWRRFALLGARGYIQYLRYYYFIKINEEAGGGPELVYIAKSFDDLFSYLGDMVAEKPQGFITRSELVEVLQALAQFVPDIKVSDGFLKEAMKLKKILFGGSIDYFAPGDFIKARSKVDTFRALTEKMMVYLPLYTGVWNAQLGSFPSNQRYFKEAEASLIEVFKGLGGMIEDSYDLSDLGKIAEEFEKLYPSQGTDFSVTSYIRRYLPLMIASKQVLFSDNQTVVSKEQWSPLMIVGGQLLGRALYYQYFVDKPGASPTGTIYHANGLVALGAFLRDSLNVIDQVVERKPRQAILFADLEKLTEAANNAEILPKILDLKTINNLVRVVFLKILIRPERRIQGDPPLGLTKEATAMIRDEFAIWFEAQKFFEDEIFAGQPAGAQISGKEILRHLPADPQAPIVKNELRVIFESPQSRAVDPQGRLVISSQQYPYSLDSVDTTNLTRLLARLVQRSYAMDLVRVKDYLGINQAEANLLFADIKPFVVALGLLNEKDTSFADSRFREANLFTPRGNGDGLASFVELSDIVLDIFSGLKLDAMVKAKVLSTDPQVGCQIYRDSVDDKQKIKVSCFVDTYRRELDQIFSSMPMQRDYMKALPRCRKISQMPWITDPVLRGQRCPEGGPCVAEENINQYLATCAESFDGMLVSILKAAGYAPEGEGIVTIASTSLVPHVMQYIETMMQRFDRNHDGVLNNPESMSAFPIFKPILSTVSGYSDDKTLRGLLGWFMVKGKPPETIAEKAYFYVFFRNSENNWDINTTQGRLASILGFIGDALSNKKSGIIGVDPTGEAKQNIRLH